MKRLFLWIGCCLAAVPPVVAREGVRFDLPYSFEHDKYIVVLGTSVGPRRFIFDTGSPRTAISESLCNELALSPVGTMPFADFEGHLVDVGLVRMDSLRMGDALFRAVETLVLPDSSLIFPCLKIDGIAGCDLLRRLVVRISDADSTISFADRIAAFGKPCGRHSCRMYLDTGCPHITADCSSGKHRLKTRVRFDTGSPGYYHYGYGEADRWLDRGFAENLRWADGFSANMGWTNRTKVERNFRAVVPRFDIAGTTIADMPMESTCGGLDLLGRKLLDWGRVVLDFPRKRFYFLPYAAGPRRAESQPLYNFTPWHVAGRLVVGQVWDEALQGVVAPGDAIVAVDGRPWPGDVCAFLLDQQQFDGRTCEIETADGRRIVLVVKKL